MIQTNCVTVSTRQAGEVLVGCPPEIIKWFLRRGRPIPCVIVLPRDFLIDNRLNIEPEFPVYGNFFVQKKRATIIGTGDQLRRVRTILSESFFGPRGREGGRKEREFLRTRRADGRRLKLEELVNLLPIGPKDNCVEICGVTIRKIRAGCFEVWEDGSLLGRVDTTDFTLPPHPPDLFKEIPLEPPAFGVTFLGTGSGFNPFRRNTSLVLWLEGKGVLVDPGVNPWSELNALGIEDVDVPSVFLTHCHADHDAGMIRAVIHQRRIRLMTSRVVFESFLRKAKALTGSDIRQHVDYVEINPGETLTLGHATIVVSAAFHSIPTIRFEVVFHEHRSKKDLKIAYSADTCFDPDRIEKMYRRRIIDSKRLDELLRFGFDADLLIHEAGREAIHTSADELEHFPEEVKKKLILVHTGDVAGNLNGLRVAQEGETIELVPTRPSFLDRTGLMASNSIFESLGMDTLRFITKRSVEVRFKAGERIISQGDQGDFFYVIARGKAKVVAGGTVRAILGRGDYFGEISLLQGDSRNATVQAISDGSALAIDKDTFLEIIRKAPLVRERIQHVLGVRPIVSQQIFLSGLSADQLARLSIRFSRRKGYRGDRVVKQEKRGDAFFVLASGEAVVLVRDRKGREGVVAKLGPGDVFGEIALLKNIPRTATVEITSESAELLRLGKRDFHSVVDSIPSLSFYLHRVSSQRLRMLMRKGYRDLTHRPSKESV
jgi:CRP-like cAMP-binding protein/ribonuclease BN (tRNA processing enzyme)